MLSSFKVSHSVANGQTKSLIASQHRMHVGTLTVLIQHQNESASVNTNAVHTTDNIYQSCDHSSLLWENSSSMNNIGVIFGLFLDAVKN